MHLRAEIREPEKGRGFRDLCQANDIVMNYGSGTSTSGFVTAVTIRLNDQTESGLETRSLPTLTRSYPRRFTFYVADPSAPLKLVRSQLAHRLPSQLYLDHSHCLVLAPAT